MKSVRANSARYHMFGLRFCVVAAMTFVGIVATTQFVEGSERGVLREGGEQPRTRPGDALRVYCGWRGSDYSPFHRWERTASTPVGFEPDLIARVAVTLNKTVSYVTPTGGMSNPRIEMLTRGQADVVISTFSITPARSRHVAFSRPYFVDGLGAMVRANAPFQSPAQLAAKRLRVVSGTTGEAWIKANWPQATIVGSLFSDEVTSVASGSVDAYMNDRSHLVNLAAGDQRVRVLPGYLTREPWGIAVALNNTTLLNQINAALSSLETSGELAALQRRWLGP
jgi:ABC-type amino acid transport substrate-binding protein